MFVAESVLSNAHISRAMTGIQLVNSSLLLRNCTVDFSGGVQLTGSGPISLTVVQSSLSTRFGNGIDASLHDFDLSVINSRLTSYDMVADIRCSELLNVHVINSTLETPTRDVAIKIGGNVTRATVAVESTTFTGRVQLDDFTSDLRSLVRLF